MASSRPERRTISRAPIRKRRLAGVLAVIALAGVVAGELAASPPSTGPSPAPPGELRGAPAAPAGPVAGGTAAGSLGEADGAVPEGTTVFDDGVPGVANLDPALLAALRRAAADAARAGVGIRVDSGWRSARYQQRLLDDAVVKYGSDEEAARWVATPDRSAHVSGDAVDIGPSEATAWLSRHGAGHGLCQIYGNEPWHYELRPRARAEGCPPRYADPAHDPRLRR